MSEAAFFEQVGKITGLTDYHLGAEELAGILRGLHPRVSPEEMQEIARAFVRIFATGIAIGQSCSR